MNNSWFIFSEGQQLGPYTGEQLVQFAQEARITPETMIWAEGMADWLPAAQIPGLFSQTPTPAPTPAPAPAPSSPAWAPPGTRTSSAIQTSKTIATGNLSTGGSVSAAPPGGPYPYFPVKAVSFGMWMSTLVGALISCILMIICFVTAATAALQAPNPEVADQISKSRMMMGAVMLAVFSICSIISAIFLYINLYRAWVCLQPASPRTSPGKAIGMLFIPFFQLYWIFVAVAGLAKDWNRIMASYQGLESAPRMKENMFLMLCIGALVFPPLALIMIFPVMSQICKGVNFFAFRRDPNKPSPFATGGFKFS